MNSPAGPWRSSRPCGPEHYQIAVNANNLAAIEYRRGRHAEADTLWRRALAIKEKTLGRAHPEVATTLTNLGVLAFAQGRPGEAEALWRRSLAILEPLVGADHPVRLAAETNLATLTASRHNEGNTTCATASSPEQVAAATATFALIAPPAGAATRPLTKADCRDGGWQSVGGTGYSNQGDCVRAPNHGAVVEVPDGTGLIENHNETVLTTSRLA